MDSKFKAFEERMLRLMQQQFPNGGDNNGGSNNNGIQKNRVGHNKYCWTHGLCNHISKECKNKKEGHKDDATFKNRMGGSSKGIKSEWRCGMALVNHVNNNNTKLTNRIQHQAVIPPPLQQYSSYKDALGQPFTSSVMAKLDSGASKSYFQQKDSPAQE